MAKNKQKPAIDVRPQGSLHVHVPSHTNQGGSLVLGLKSALGTLSGYVSHIPHTNLSLPPTVIPTSDAGPSTVREADGSPVANGSTSLDEFLDEDYSDEEELEEDPKGASLDPFKIGKAAILTIHESGWLVYKFQNEEEKFSVLCGDPYLVYGRPLILRSMTECFDFSCSEMTQVPTLRCLFKLASVLGKPIQCDKLTSSKERLSYAQVLVEVDFLADLRSSINVVLPNGNPLIQRVIYETLPKFCKLYKVFGHTTRASSPVDAPPANALKVDALIVPTTPIVAQDEQ
ncbi:hypothetical protein Peur_058658 [Populus x canadensis]